MTWRAPSGGPWAGALRDTQGELEGVNAKFRALRADFLYNLQLLQERDAELDASDVELGALRAVRTHGYCSPHRRMAFNSRHDDSQCVR